MDKEEQAKQQEQKTLPAYHEFLYGDIYNNLDRSRRRNNNFCANFHYWGQYGRLTDALLREVRQSTRVLQLGMSLGNELKDVARRVGAYGVFDIVDFNQCQIDLRRQELDYPCINYICQDAAEFTTDDPYDVVICFFLLSELPLITKKKVINAALSAVKKGGKVVFIDGHNPLPLHPLRYLVRMHNRLHHPFVEKLWDRDIDTFANNKTDFIWRKSTYFGRMYQKVIATRKDNLIPLDEEKTKIIG